MTTAASVLVTYIIGTAVKMFWGKTIKKVLEEFSDEEEEEP